MIPIKRKTNNEEFGGSDGEVNSIRHRIMIVKSSNKDPMEMINLFKQQKYYRMIEDSEEKDLSFTQSLHIDQSK